MFQYKEYNIYTAFLLKMLIAFLVFFLCRVFFVLFNYEFYEQVSFATWVNLFRGGFVFDAAGLGYIMSLFILSQAIPIPWRHAKGYQKVTNILFFVPLFLGLIINIADSVYYFIGLKRTTSAIFAQFQNETNLGVLGVSFLYEYWYLFILVGILGYLLWKWTVSIQIKPKRNDNPLKYFSLAILFFILTIVGTIGAIRGGLYKKYRPMSIIYASNYINQPNQMAVVLNTPFTVIRSLGKSALEQRNYFDIETQTELFSALQKPINVQDSIATPKKNVVVLILESFGREYFGALNKDTPGYNGFTPFLDSLISVSYTFKNSYANGRKSIAGMPSVLASIPSLTKPFIISPYSGNEVKGLPSHLRNMGYYSAFFHGATNGSMDFDSFAKQSGFDDYYGRNEYNNEKHFDNAWGIWDEHFMQYMAKKMKGFKEPFLSALFSLSSHHPFKLPKEYEGKFPKGTVPIHKMIGYTDMAIRKFFDAIKNEPWYNNTIFIITADHSSTLNHLDKYKTPMGFFAVPFIIYDPSSPQMVGFDSVNVVQQIDIMPTVLNKLGYQEEYIAFGRDVFNTEKPKFAVTFMEGSYHLFYKNYVLQYDEKNIVGFYNFETDPLFKNNMKNKDSPIKDKMLDWTKAFIQEHNYRLIENKLVLKK